MRKYYLGLASNYSGADIVRHTFAIGSEQDCRDLSGFLNEKYHGESILCKNGRSALALALMAYFEPGDTILINGFTCYAVYEAVKAAGLKPLFIDINTEDLNFNLAALEAKLGDSRLKGIIIQNSLGNPVDIKAIEKLAKKHELTIIEDLAHCTGVKYSDEREAGTVGAATVLSFGKDKSIDTISGGAVILRDLCKNPIQAPSFLPKPSDHLRARFYPVFGALCRCLNYVHLGGLLMRLLLKIHWVEKSADNSLDLRHKPSKFEAKLALKQLKALKKNGEKPLREFYLVNNRDEVLSRLAKKGYHFGGFWYEKPVSPIRYYKKVRFPEKDCPTATFVAEHIINFPTYYRKKDLAKAYQIIAEYLITEEGDKHE